MAGRAFVCVEAGGLLGTLFQVGVRAKHVRLWLSVRVGIPVGISVGGKQDRCRIMRERRRTHNQPFPATGRWGFARSGRGRRGGRGVYGQRRAQKGDGGGSGGRGVSPHRNVEQLECILSVV